MKHTKGEWKQRRLFPEPILIQEEDGLKREWFTNSIDIHGADDRIICNVDYQTNTEEQGYGKNDSIELWEANAKLIAAAPELLEALKDLFEYASIESEQSIKLYKKAELAIKKATQ